MLWSLHTNAPAVRVEMMESESTAKKAVHPIVHKCASLHILQIKMYWVHREVDKIAKGANRYSIVRSKIKVNGGRENSYSLRVKWLSLKSNKDSRILNKSHGLAQARPGSGQSHRVWLGLMIPKAETNSGQAIAGPSSQSWVRTTLNSTLLKH